MEFGVVSEAESPQCLSTMFAESAIQDPSPLQLILVGVLQIAVVLLVCWFGTRRQRSEFRIARVASFTLLCLASALPFAAIAYLLRPWDWESRLVRSVVLLGVLVPFVTAFALGLLTVRF